MIIIYFNFLKQNDREIQNFHTKQLLKMNHKLSIGTSIIVTLDLVKIIEEKEENDEQLLND